MEANIFLKEDQKYRPDLANKFGKTQANPFDDVNEDDLFQSHQIQAEDNNYYYDEKNNAHTEEATKVFIPPRSDYPEMPRTYIAAEPNIIHKGRRNYH